MSDKELLELSAKAAGLHVLTWNHAIPALLIAGPTAWNPLADDGDALRLAVKLGMQIDMRDPETHVYLEGCAQKVDQYHKDKDAYAATRRAIVRAAAEIGKNMP